MKSIVYKRDIENFLNGFSDLADYDFVGKKHYLVFEDSIRNGSWTLMYYEADGKWTIHGKGENYSDEGEKELIKEDLINFIYKNRKYVNREIKKKNRVLA
ncbi:hypothetical protein A8F94_15355 [Bacillus sp. FJAT-27225]|uniref:hypothetical protein n=1 Tax=Bacillus sp. FJAT-27225 TaxID=1743144 RepID=UPI00080C2719|nr:hypothetical protein [Bacillus sp. FJAT-27225]OCA84101.1 hypothetical protein A8F94_15355 [Bacillus sp. FJAT-27225]